MKLKMSMFCGLLAISILLCCGLPCFAQETPTAKPAAQPEVSGVPVPPSMLAKIQKVHIGSTRGFLEKTLSVATIHWLPPFDFLYLIAPPAEFHKKYPSYYIGLPVTFGHDYLPATRLNPPGMSKADKHYNEGYNSAVVTAIGKPFVTIRTAANTRPTSIE